MALDINIRITAGAEGELTDHEKSILSSLAAHPSQGTAATLPIQVKTEVYNSAPAVEAAPEEKTPEAAPAPKKPTTRRPKAANPKPVPVEDVPMAMDDDLTPDPEAVEEKVEETTAEPVVEGKVVRTVDDAVTATMDLVKVGKMALVKSALEAAGAKKVSELAEDQLDTFFSVIEA